MVAVTVGLLVLILRMWEASLGYSKLKVNLNYIMSPLKKKKKETTRMCFALIFAVGSEVNDFFQIKRIAFCLLSIFIMSQEGRGGTSRVSDYYSSQHESAIAVHC